MNKLIDKILSRTFCNYLHNQATNEEIANFKKTVIEKYDIYVEDQYLNFLSLLNGFELNGLNFYGTKEQLDKYTLGALNQNEFWRSELTTLKQYYLLADGDMDFYCYSSISGQYCVLTKGSLEKMSIFNTFCELMKYLVETYINQ